MILTLSGGLSLGMMQDTKWLEGERAILLLLLLSQLVIGYNSRGHCGGTLLLLIITVGIGCALIWYRRFGYFECIRY